MVALRKLTPALRHVFILRALYERTHVEIAAMLEISVSASEVRFHRAIKQLRHTLSDLSE
jgi:RNA polymerase sigma-70 factor (ECF subfamily)